MKLHCRTGNYVEAAVHVRGLQRNYFAEQGTRMKLHYGALARNQNETTLHGKEPE